MCTTFAFKNRKLLSVALTMLFGVSTPSLAVISQVDEPLFYSSSDLPRWRERAEIGPYKTRSDVKPASPGDWAKVEKHYKKFMEIDGTRSSIPAPENDPTKTTDKECYLKIPYIHDNDLAAEIRDTAFYGLVKGQNSASLAARDALLTLAEDPVFDFTADDRWCDGKVNDGKFGFHFAEWMTRLVVAYDFMRASLNDAERQVILTWFKDYAYYAREDLKTGFAKVFKKREALDFLDRDYSLHDSYAHEQRPPVIVEDPENAVSAEQEARIGYFYNNRRGQFARISGLIGILTEDPLLKNDGVQYCHEYLMFGVSNKGYPIEFERNRFSHREVGFQYSMQTLGQCLTLASVMARLGDTSLFDYHTNLGPSLLTGELEAQPAPANYEGKSLLFITRAMAGHLDGTYQRYVFLKPDSKNPFLKSYDEILSDGSESLSDYLIDGIEPVPKTLTKNDAGVVIAVADKSPWYSVADTMLAEANQYWDDQYLRDIYFRDSEQMSSYPWNPAGFGTHYGFGGESSIYPGVMFMFAQDKPDILQLKIFNPHNGQFTEVNTEQLTLRQAEYPDGFSIVAVGELSDQNGHVGSVEFYVNGVKKKLENYAPFSLNGDKNNIPYAYSLPSGTHQLSMVPYHYKKAKGARGSEYSLQLTIE